MGSPFNLEQLKQLEAFVDICKKQPLLLHHPKLSFFKDYLVSLGVTLPPPEAKMSTDETESKPDSPTEQAGVPTEPQPDEESEESDVQLDMEGVIEGDAVADQEMGDPSKEPTEEEQDQSDEKRSAAMSAVNDANLQQAIDLYTEAIKLNPQSALLFAKRGQVYLKLNKPNACIKDCTRALELNCDSASAYKFRGRAYRLLGQFEEACRDLCESLKIDYDDQTNEWLAEIRPNADKLRQHKLALQRKKEEKERAARANARKAQAPKPSAPIPPNLGAAMFDDDIVNFIQDPEILKAYFEICNDPANIMKYHDNPKVMNAIMKMQNKFKAGAFDGAKQPEEPAEAPKPAEQPKPSVVDDVGLD